MKIQLALDRLSRDECFQLVSETLDFIDWIEIGTGVIKEYGMSIVKEMKALYPDKMLVADMKTCDAGRHEAKQAFDAGADIITVMGFSHDQTILDTLAAANERGKLVMVDLLQINDPNRVKELRQLGVELFCLHIGKDSQSTGELAGAQQLELVSRLASVRIAIAGGIDLKTVSGLKASGIEVAIVGSAITKSADARNSAKMIKQAINS